MIKSFSGTDLFEGNQFGCALFPFPLLSVSDHPWPASQKVPPRMINWGKLIVNRGAWVNILN